MLLPQNNREEKSSRHVAMVARVLDDDKPIKSLKSVFALFQASPILFNFVWFGKSWRNFLWDRISRYLSSEKESDNFCVVFTFSIKWAGEIRKVHVVFKRVSWFQSIINKPVDSICAFDTPNSHFSSSNPDIFQLFPIPCCVSLIIHKARTTFYTEFVDDNSCDLGKLFRGMKAPKDSL